VISPGPLRRVRKGDYADFLTEKYR